MSIAKTDFENALARLEGLAKSQLHHTGSDSNPGSHAGVKTSDYQDEHSDGIDENGTDYDGVKKALAAKVEKSQALTPAEVAIVKGQDPREAIMQKISSGQSLTPAESWAIKGGISKMIEDDEDDELEISVSKGNDKPCKAGVPGEADDAGSVPDSHAGDSEQDEIEPDAKKSLESAVGNTTHLRKGLEVSPILVEFARAMGEALQGTEARTRQTIVKSLTPVVSRIAELEKSVQAYVSDQGEFNRGFAETLVGVGQHVAGNSEVAAAAATQPVRAPKSQFQAGQQGQQGQQGVQVLEKAFGPGGLDVGTDAMQKSQVISAMLELSKANKINSLDVIKYETTNEISPSAQQLVLQQVQKGAN